VIDINPGFMLIAKMGLFCDRHKIQGLCRSQKWPYFVIDIKSGAGFARLEPATKLRARLAAASLSPDFMSITK